MSTRRKKKTSDIEANLIEINKQDIDNCNTKTRLVNKKVSHFIDILFARLFCAWLLLPVSFPVLYKKNNIFYPPRSCSVDSVRLEYF